jgi:hypothetical protein
MLEGMQHLVFAACGAEDFQRAVGDDLVGVHVRRGARAPLDDVDDELVVQCAGTDFDAGGNDRVTASRVQQAEFAVGHGRRLFHRCEGRDELRVGGQRDARDVEVLQRPRGVDAEVGGGRDRVVTERVALLTCCTGIRNVARERKRHAHRHVRVGATMAAPGKPR